MQNEMDASLEDELLLLLLLRRRKNRRSWNSILTRENLEH